MRGLLLLAALSLLACRKPAETQANLLKRLPTQDATVVSIDVQTLRRAGILTLLAAGNVEPEYQSFISASGFDYQRDLDAALVAFSPSGTFFLLSGRFDWKKLEAYAQANGGSCYERLCHMTGSKPERRISFLPIENGLMALAVSGDDLAASRLTKPGLQRAIDVPPEPVWVSLPGASLRKPGVLPEATRTLAGALTTADQVVLALGAHGDAYAARMEAVCRSPEDARVLTGQLTKLTKLFRAGDDLPGMLAGGSFTDKDRKVFGYWPVRKRLIETLTGGI